MTKYVSAFLALAAALTGIVGETHDEANSVTTLGWGAIIVAALSFVAITVETYRDHRALDWQDRQKVEIGRVASRQIVEALRHLLIPFYVVLHEIWKKSPGSKLVELG